MSAQSWWSRNRTFVIVVAAILALCMLTALVFMVSGSGDSGIAIAPLESPS